MQYLVFWLIFPYAAYTIAKSKDLNTTLWIVIGLLLGPFALLAVALAKPGPNADTRYQ